MRTIKQVILWTFYFYLIFLINLFSTSDINSIPDFIISSLDCGEKTNNESDKNPKPKFSSKGIFTLILPADDRTDLLVRCTPCQRLYIGIEGWMRHKRVSTRILIWFDLFLMNLNNTLCYSLSKRCFVNSFCFK